MKLRFYKDEEGGWFADVDGHTKAQNRMVAGADTLIEAMSKGRNEVVVDLVDADLLNKEDYPKSWIIKMTRFEHDPFGATYLCKIKGKVIPWPAWLCNVTHTVFGEHPKRIFITGVN